MKILINYFIFVCVLSFIYCCSNDSSNNTNNPPASTDSTVILSSPVNGFVFHTPDSVNILFQWRKTLNAPYYELQLDADSLFPSPLIFYSNDTLNTITINSNNSPSNFWRVRIYNNVHATFFWSERRWFVIQP